LTHVVKCTFDIWITAISFPSSLNEGSGTKIPHLLAHIKFNKSSLSRNWVFNGKQFLLMSLIDNLKLQLVKKKKERTNELLNLNLHVGKPLVNEAAVSVTHCMSNTSTVIVPADNDVFDFELLHCILENSHQIHVY
jgi:hypothetical protein